MTPATKMALKKALIAAITAAVTVFLKEYPKAVDQTNRAAARAR